MGLVEKHKFSSSQAVTWLKNGCIVALNENKCFLGWGDSQQKTSPDESGYSLFMPDFYLKNSEPWRIYEKSTILSNEEIHKCLAEVKNLEKPDRSWQPPMYEDFEKVFNSVQSKIFSGQLQKAVPLIFEASHSGLQTQELLGILKILTSQGDPLQKAYGYWSDEEGGLLGLTPEVLFEIDQTEFKTMALAGTRPAEKADELLSDEKELYEHSLVVEALVEKLKGNINLNISETKSQIFGCIAHLMTKISSEANGQCSFIDYINALHPTPALGTSPPIPLSDMAFLECNYDRHHYGAPFGLLTPDKKAYAYVAIRNLQWCQQTLLLGSGCGVVAQSECKKEWAELTLKRQSVKKNLGLL